MKNSFLSEVKNLDFRLKTTNLFSLKSYWSVFFIGVQRRGLAQAGLSSTPGKWPACV
jgi:hypothetical protein